MQSALVYTGLGIAAATLGAILWSIAFPGRGVWPPKRYTAITPVLVWVPTFALFGVLIALGILNWAILSIPNWVRFGIGLPFILIGNIVVWSEVSHFGISQTAGARGILRTSGMYRYSRNPQYVADIMIICGWIVLSSAPAAAMVGAPAIAALIAAPFAEESWLRKQYGAEFVSYTTQVRRFL